MEWMPMPRVAPPATARSLIASVPRVCGLGAQGSGVRCYGQAPAARELIAPQPLGQAAAKILPSGPIRATRGQRGYGAAGGWGLSLKLSAL